MPKRILPHNHGDDLELLLERIPETEGLGLAADLFKEVSDSTRLRIFWLLCHCEECVINLSAVMDMSPPAVSHHLARLRTAGLIVSRREGKEVYYRAAETKAAQLLHRMVEDMVEIACPDILGQKGEPHSHDGH
ncbi:MAG: winged helix-turn-helix transcriptional regulator [Clostridia bacterium]|nr:winged helix-turn-helix transcriptional regulator [Clostridia bacterium]